MLENKFIKIRPVCADDMAQITAIYAEQVELGTGSFETVAPSAEVMLERMQTTLDKELPYIVLEADGVVMGYAYAGYFHHRTAYNHTLEDSIYLHKDARGKGYGKLLLKALIEDVTAKGFRQMVSIIGDSDNVGSIGLHKACGFEMVGTLKSVGWKHGKWVDSVYMQLALGKGATTKL
ncbi:MAG: GNAT family N-acetyltransferase [Hyphomicrobiales bacterium]|nr:N-acetyltransferase [Hyphomicrobiales bacterium]PCH50346.1 MAG: GNAT family N-acetyltransferase [Hyphomicrobiales bacterium]